MKMSFNTLIESIREFFMSIDAKLKELGVAIEGKVGDLEIAGSRCSGKAENDKLEMLTMRMAYMEENIKKAQENEARLISIIEEMNNNKRYLSEEQPTIRKEPERGLPLAACKQGTNSQPETSFRLFSMGYPPEKPLYQPQQNQPTYKKFQQYSNHPVV